MLPMAGVIVVRNTRRPRAWAAVTKSVTSLWSKTLGYFPKGPGAANAVSRIVVAHAQDIDGSPFAGEVVCFAADQNAEAVFRFDGTLNKGTPNEIDINVAAVNDAPKLTVNGEMF